jgi:acyl carrier protein
MVIDCIREMLARRDADPGDVNVTADIYEELGLDSLEVAELSAVLEDSYGTDPYSAGELPKTVQDVVAFYG